MVPLVAAAVCPHPPLLVPEVAGAAAAELDDLRAACAAAVTQLYASGARSIVIVGAGDRSATLDVPVRGTFAPWGVPIEVRLGGPADGRVATEGLPLSLLVGAWLARRVPPPAGADDVSWRMLSLAVDEPAERCAEVGRRTGTAQPWAMLVMGDGSACRGERAPGYDDPRAAPYDAVVARALTAADTGALLDLDPELSAELKVAGRAPWQVLAGAVRAEGGDWRGELTYDAAPHGVAYFVASWRPA
ncbi:class III extradiol dioxygenase subunit B-like domain-containing protein [Micromonospora sp. WMMA1363]|uniref:class III extradiol dioxygenase subunit B-like domain-containing protein n=1 Tax=Micromonospora sp. WMMA1363 TaxID=3053985 RepID=UPI00259CC79D|nr:class III extradiol dioxygenase subunit B-like domain-containing protein [Micromonospora sp. WMMA1363]MDM4723220.1 class III extradiol dioxygenase subunit B-like domain-containing protein [Micromonospora sp. WMMA1363]